MSRIRISLVGVLLVVLLSLSTVVKAEPPQKFCKCTCFKNSTIIPLTLTHDPTNDKPNPNPSKPDNKDGSNKPAPSSPPPAPAIPPPTTPGKIDRDLCKQCNIAFCLSNTLPICKDADPEKDVKTFCFQRDRTEDQVIVWGFILGTLGLLGWAGLRGVVEARDRSSLRAAGASAAAAQGQGQTQGQEGSLPFNTPLGGGGGGGNTGAGTGGGFWQRILGIGGAGRGGGTYAPLDDTAR